MHNSKRMTISTHVLAREVGGEMIILDLDSGEYFGVDNVGLRIWQLLADGATTTEICNAIVAEYGSPYPQVEADCDSFLSELEQRRLISVTY